MPNPICFYLNGKCLGRQNVFENKYYYIIIIFNQIDAKTTGNDQCLCINYVTGSSIHKKNTDKMFIFMDGQWCEHLN